MEKNYSQAKAMFAIAGASLKATFRSPSAVIFSIGFPLIFILVFGFIGGGSGISLDVAFNKQSDTFNMVYQGIKQVPAVKIKNKPETELKEDLEKGRITAIINIRRNNAPNPEYLIDLTTSEAVNPQNVGILQTILTSVIANINKIKNTEAPTIASVNSKVESIPGRVYRRIDFILPGQLGFSLLSAGVFGVSFLFFNLRQQLVLKRFFATPIKKTYIVLGEAISRVLFQLMTAVIIVGMGVLAFKFTLVNGLVTFMEILVLSFIALVVFMGYGFIVSSLAKNESTIPPFANLFTLPQFLLAGTFFPIDVFPKWLQFICNLLPLTHFNNAMRNIAFEGASLLSVWKEIGIMAIWGVILYGIAVKVFRWE
ncbi:ABC transporter permease [Foetidibacter luteolus]|uniref:ABC transporter permease n=1 Tax=Foetidibacter luteolus TaxID=2608880 RepID=UPI00129A97DF|nr:ABC transporter permease [Foetidibacter luteolus]